VKDFLCCQAATSRGKFVTKLTADFVNALMEWFFIGFERVIGMSIDAEDTHTHIVALMSDSELYDASD
jgi:hypothetical protein